MERYTWNPADYAEHSHAQYLWAGEVIAKLDLKGTESVLDIGCGDGKVTALLASHLPSGEVIGIDSSAGMVNCARESFPGSEYPNISFLCMDALDIRFSERFDLVFSNATLHWVQDHATMLQGVNRCLKNRGRIFFQMGGRGNAREILDLAGSLIHSGRWRRYFSDFRSPYTFLSAEEYQVLLRDTGFHPIRVELIPKDMTQVGCDGLCGWIRTTWLPYTERIPEQQKNRFISDLAESYLEKYPPGSEGLIHVGMVRLEVEAQKPG